MNVGCHQRRKKILLTSVMIGVGEKEFSFVVDSAALSLRFCTHNHQFDAHFFDAQLVHRLNVRVGDDDIYVFHVADLGKSASAKTMVFCAAFIICWLR